MTKEENILFCKIAVHNNFVSAADANAVLREAGNGDVRELFLHRGLMDEATCVKIMRAVAKRTGKAAPAKPAPRAKKAAEKRTDAAHEPRRPAKPLTTNQMVAGVVGLVVFLVCITYFAYILATGGGEPEPSAPAPKSAPTAVSTPGAVTPGVTPAPGTPGAAPPPPVISEAYRQTIEQALNEADSDATNSMTTDTMGPRGLASLENWKKDYGKSASQEQLQRYEQRRNQLLGAIKMKFERHKAEVVAAKDKGDTTRVNELRSEIAKYADAATMSELEALLK